MSTGGAESLTGQFTGRKKAVRPPADAAAGRAAHPAAPGHRAQRPHVRVIPGATADTAKIDFNGQVKTVIEWEAEAGLETARSNTARAIEIYDAILAAFPRYARAWYNKGVLLHTAYRRLEEALGCYVRAEESLPGNLDILHNKAKVLAELRRPRDAEAVYLQILKTNPNYLKSLEGYAALLINSGRSAEAVALLERAVEIYRSRGHNPYRAQQLLATALTNLDRPKDALKVLNDALQRHPNDDSLWEAKGIALSNMEKYREAVTCLTQALRLNRGNTFALGTRQQLLEVCRARKIRFSEAELAF